MTTRLSILVGLTCLLPLSCHEEKKTKVEPATEAEKEEPPPSEKKPLINIPAGAVITDLTLPYFDEDRKVVSLMTIKELSVNDDADVTEETLLSGKTLKLWLFDSKEAVSTITTIPTATYRMEREIVEADGEILTRNTSDNFAAKSSGGIFALATGQALLFGPATTRFDLPGENKKSTTMNLRPLLPAVAISQTLLAEPLQVTPEQLAEFERKVAPRMIPDIDGRANFAKARPLGQQITKRLTNFLDSVDQTILISNDTSPTAVADEQDPLKDLFKPKPESIIINCSKGIYLDGENREIVYLGNIKINGQGMIMTCKQDLKAIFDKPPAEEEQEKPSKEEDKKGDPLSRFSGLGDLKQFTANGDVRVNGVNEKGQKIYFGGDRALYEMTRKGEGNDIDATITMRGDKLALMLGDPKKKGGKAALRSTSLNSWLVAEIRGDVIKVRTSDNGWETVLIQNN
ncbi:MAG: hypothetical protein ACPGAP_08650 [Akkermansiaceae bacterium]